MAVTDETSPQLELPVADVHIHRMRAAQLKEACRAVAIARSFARTATELDQIFESEGRPVSLGTLHNTLGDHERHYMRAEWIPYFAAHSQEVAEVIAIAAGCHIAPAAKLKPEDELELLRERVMREFGVAGARLVMSVGGGARRR
jgi:hypothetical protein